MLESLQSTTPLVPGGPAWLTLPFALIAGGVVVALLILWLGARSAGKKRRTAREAEEEALAARYDAEVPATRPITPRPPEPQPEPVVAAPEPEPVVAEPEPVAEEPAPFCEAPAAAEHVEGAPAREPEPEALAEAPNPEAEPIDASPAGLGSAENEPPVAAVGETMAAGFPTEAEPVAPEAVAMAIPNVIEEYAEVESRTIDAKPITVLVSPALEEEAAAPAPLADEPIAAAAPMEASPASLAADLAEPEPVAAEPAAAPEPEPVAEPLHVAVEEAPELAAAVPPEPVAEAAPAPAAPAGPDDLTRMKGVGPRLAERLNTVGITRFADIAALTPEAAAELDSKLGDFQGRLDRDRWIDQAGYLANGDIAGFEETFGKL